MECHETLWFGVEDRVKITRGGWLSPFFWARVVRTYLRLLQKYSHIGKYDVLVVGYPGQFDVYLARLLAWLRRKPLAWDIFMSIYLIAKERQLDRYNNFTLKLLRFFEGIACHLPNQLILDTPDYADWFVHTYGIRPDRFRLVPTGADDRIFNLTKIEDPFTHEPGVFKIVYHGTFIPNHGVETIIRAAYLLRNELNIRFEMIGDGPEKRKATLLAEQERLKNIEFIGWLEKDELVKRIVAADLCLGVFGVTPQSLMTVQNKIFECLALGLPVITGDSPTIRRYFVDQEHLYLVKRSDPEALADAILDLFRNREKRLQLANSGHNRFLKEFTVVEIGKSYANLLEGTIASQ